MRCVSRPTVHGGYRGLCAVSLPQNVTNAARRAVHVCGSFSGWTRSSLLRRRTSGGVAEAVNQVKKSGNPQNHRKRDRGTTVTPPCKTGGEFRPKSAKSGKSRLSIRFNARGRAGVAIRTVASCSESAAVPSEPRSARGWSRWHAGREAEGPERWGWRAGRRGR